MRINRKSLSVKRNSSKFDYVKFNQLKVILYHDRLPVIPIPYSSSQLLHNGLPVRSFSSSPSRKGDPLGTVIAAVSTPYTLSFLNNPLAGMFIVLMGMATTLFFVTTSLSESFAQDSSYLYLIQRLDSILLLCERFLSSAQDAINILFANINSFNSGTLYSFYLSLQELVAITESLYSILNILVSSLEVELLPGPIVDRINHNFEDLRLVGNNLMSLIRNIEDRLEIPSQDRIPSF